MQPLKWTDNRLKIGELYIGETMHHADLKQEQHSAWFSSDSIQELIGLFSTQEEAAAAVEKRYYHAVGVTRSPPDH